MEVPETITVLVYEEDGEWIARALEFDIIGVGDCPARAYSTLLDLLAFHIQYAFEHGLESFLHRPAPAKYWAMLKDAEKISREPLKTPGKIPYREKVDRYELAPA